MIQRRYGRALPEADAEGIGEVVHLLGQRHVPLVVPVGAQEVLHAHRQLPDVTDIDTRTQIERVAVFATLQYILLCGLCTGVRLVSGGSLQTDKKGNVMR